MNMHDEQIEWIGTQHSKNCCVRHFCSHARHIAVIAPLVTFRIALRLERRDKRTIKTFYQRPHKTQCAILLFHGYKRAH